MRGGGWVGYEGGVTRRVFFPTGMLTLNLMADFIESLNAEFVAVGLW